VSVWDCNNPINQQDFRPNCISHKKMVGARQKFCPKNKRQISVTLGKRIAIQRATEILFSNVNDKHVEGKGRKKAPRRGVGRGNQGYQGRSRCVTCRAPTFKSPSRGTIRTWSRKKRVENRPSRTGDIATRLCSLGFGLSIFPVTGKVSQVFNKKDPTPPDRAYIGG